MREGYFRQECGWKIPKVVKFSSNENWAQGLGGEKRKKIVKNEGILMEGEVKKIKRGKKMVKMVKNGVGVDLVVTMVVQMRRREKGSYVLARRKRNR